MVVYISTEVLCRATMKHGFLRGNRLNPRNFLRAFARKGTLGDWASNWRRRKAGSDTLNMKNSYTKSIIMVKFLPG